MTRVALTAVVVEAVGVVGAVEVVGEVAELVAEAVADVDEEQGALAAAAAASEALLSSLMAGAAVAATVVTVLAGVTVVVAAAAATTSAVAAIAVTAAASMAAAAEEEAATAAALQSSDLAGAAKHAPLSPLLLPLLPLLLLPSATDSTTVCTMAPVITRAPSAFAPRFKMAGPAAWAALAAPAAALDTESVSSGETSRWEGCWLGWFAVGSWSVGWLAPTAVLCLRMYTTSCGVYVAMCEQLPCYKAHGGPTA